MKNLLFLLLLTLCACENKNNETGDAPTDIADTELSASGNQEGDSGMSSTTNGSASTTVPTGSGSDLNGDGKADRLDVITTREENDGLGFKRRLVVYSGEGADRDAWYTAEDVILSTEHGGMMGDPLESAEIENGTIVISHFGGSRAKWHYTHRFRWQNGDFKLIGTTIETNDECTQYTKLDYNLSTGNAEYTTTPQDCTGNEVKQGDTAILNFIKKTTLPAMNGFKTGENELQAPGMKEPAYY